jgi:hypothetical protein
MLFKIGVNYLYSFFLKKLQNEGLKYLIEVIIGVLKKDGVFCNVDVAKLMSFRAKSMNVFEGVHNGVAHQMPNKYGTLHKYGCANFVFKSIL